MPRDATLDDPETLRQCWKRPVDLARAVGLSATQIRTYEQVGFIPPAERSPSGYRRYDDVHLETLLLSRILIAGYGWEPALEIMRAVHARDMATVYQRVDAAHAALDRQRAEVAAAAEALATVSTSGGRDRSAYRRVGAVAKAVGVKPSAVRFWESVGLLDPHREAGTGYRLYDARQTRRLRIIALLRGGGYDFDRVRLVLDNIDSGQLEQARIALRERRTALDQVSQRVMRATAALHDFLSQGLKDQRGGARQTRP